jgi:hypothetical protein
MSCFVSDRMTATGATNPFCSVMFDCKQNAVKLSPSFSEYASITEIKQSHSSNITVSQKVNLTETARLVECRISITRASFNSSIPSSRRPFGRVICSRIREPRNGSTPGPTIFVHPCIWRNLVVSRAFTLVSSVANISSVSCAFRFSNTRVCEPQFFKRQKVNMDPEFCKLIRNEL